MGNYIYDPEKSDCFVGLPVSSAMFRGDDEICVCNEPGKTWHIEGETRPVISIGSGTQKRDGGK